ncbi:MULTISPECIES: hypothetical protein [Paenibacillus]|uniref:Secreted protein n=1 Tax=Paenibacillus violae TaxID=3077234 RepID=A0ABU3R9B0_9BACL|nr:MULTISPECIES: hypothetical protein [Paenibacillus]MDU0200870.1 hypothetical protein [Paenibacillus sp. PFR10]MEC0264729.1 hypothetical protein [Paenibacillus anseongense]
MRNRWIAVMLLVCGFVMLDDRCRAEASLELPHPGEDTITLLENTSVYGDQLKEVGLLGPQTLKILKTREVRWGHGEGYKRPIYLVSTWLGDRWIAPNRALLGNPQPFVKKLDLSGIESLYNDPLLTEPSGGQLAPQIVTTKAKWDNLYLIETRSGDKWIRPINPFLEGIREVQEDVELLNLTPLMRHPYGLETGSSLSPQTVKVKEVWNNWHQIDSWLGPVWFKLYEADAVDARHILDVNFGYQHIDEKDPKLTHMTVNVNLGPKWREVNEAMTIDFKFNWYNKNGERVAASRTGRVELNGAEKHSVDLLVDGSLDQWYAYATVQIVRINDKKAPELDASAAMDIVDPEHPKFRLGNVSVRQDGEFSIINGQFELDTKGSHQVKGRITFTDQKSQVMGTVPLELITDADNPSKGIPFSFECVFSGNLKYYATVKLEVDSITSLN